MRVIITGGTGLIGKALGASLAAQGHEVIALSRNPAKAKDMPAGVSVEQWDASTDAGWGHLADGAGAIVNLAGENLGGGRWTKKRKAAILQSRRDAGAAVMAALAHATVKPGVLVQASAVGLYGPRSRDEVITEETGLGSDFQARTAFEWEATTAGAARLGVRRALARTGLAFSTRGGSLPIMLLPFKMVIAGGPLGSGKQYVPWIHIDDHVRALEFLIGDPAAQGPFNLSAPNPVTYREFAKTAGKVMGRPSFMPTPAFALRTVLGEMSQLVLGSKRQAPARLLEMGFTFKYPELEAALRDLIENKK
jgi:uncharacterized protein (TIGR01777 family)